MSGPVKSFGLFAASLWALWSCALGLTLFGNPGAINAVAGIPLPATLVTWAAITFYRQDRGQRREAP